MPKDKIIIEDYRKKSSDVKKQIREIKNSYTEEERFRDMEQFKNLKALCMKEADCVGDDRMFRKGNQEKKHREHRKYSLGNLRRNKVIESFPPERQTAILSFSSIILYSSIAFLI